MGRLRPRSGPEKSARRTTILDAALAVCARSSFADLRTADVARAAGVAKGTFFAYFPTREALGLALLAGHLDRWCDDLERRLERLPGPPAPAILARALAASLAGRAGLLELLPLAAATQDSAFAAAWAAGLDRAGAAVEAAAPALGRGGGARVVRHAVAVAPGLRGPTLPEGASPVDALRAALEAHIIGVRAGAAPP